MFEDSINQQIRTPEAFSRGIRLATTGLVSPLQVSETEESGRVKVDGRVPGRGNKRYSVHLVLDTRSGTVIDYQCDCSEDEITEGMCHHVVAVILLFDLDHSDTGALQDRDNDSDVAEAKTRPEHHSMPESIATPNRIGKSVDDSDPLPLDTIAVSDPDSRLDDTFESTPALTNRQEAPLAMPENAADASDDAPVGPRFSFHIGENEGRITCHAEACYGSALVGLFDDARPDDPIRAIVAEGTAQRAVRTFFPQGDTDTPSYHRENEQEERVIGAYQADTVEPYFEKKDDVAYYALFRTGLRELSDIGVVFLSERLKKVRAVSAPQVNVRVDMQGSTLRLSMDASELSNEELLAYLARYRQKQRYVRLNEDDIMALDGSIGQAVDLAETLHLDPRELVNGTAEVPANRTLFVDALLEDADGLTSDESQRVREIVHDFATITQSDTPVPRTLNARLRPYQQEGFHWLSVLGRTGFGGILADDMGLGKTLQTIAYLCHAKEHAASHPALVVCPASLVYNWMAELKRFAPRLKAVAVSGTKQERHRLLHRATDADVLVTSYDLLKRDVEVYTPLRFSSLVLDEAQYIKNPDTQAAQSVKRLTAGARFALTGTPIENRLTELWSIFDFLMPGVLGTQAEFARQYRDPLEASDTTAAKHLQSLVAPFILRRLKSEVLSDLPEKNESVVYACMEGEQEKLYRANASKLARAVTHQLPAEFQSSKLQVLAALTRLRQIACDPRLAYENYHGGSAKLDTCMELIATALDGGHHILVFSQFTSMFDLIGARLDQRAIPYLQLTGSTSKSRRAELVEQFQEGKAPIFLISLKAGGVGLNLTAADIVIHYDPWWNLAAQNQATDRAHRMGQQRAVSVFKLITKGTVEEGITRMQQSKQDLADAVINGEAISSTQITREDVLALLQARVEGNGNGTDDPVV